MINSYSNIRTGIGFGESYLSNKKNYRVAFLREKSSNPNKMTGHIHLGFLFGDSKTDRDEMLTIIKDAIKQALNNF